MPSSTDPSGPGGAPGLGEDAVPVSGGLGNHLQVQLRRHLHLHLGHSFAQRHLLELTWGEEGPATESVMRTCDPAFQLTTPNQAPKNQFSTASSALIS